MKRLTGGLLSSTILRSPPGEGGGGAAGGAAGADNAGADGAGGTQDNKGSGGDRPALTDGGQASGDKGGAAAPYRPEGLPDHLFGKSDQETIDRLHKTVSGFRQTEGDRGAVPKTPDEYRLEFGDKVKPFAENFGKDPLFKQTLTIAHEAGITDKQFGKFLPKLLEHMVDSGMVEAPLDATAELLKLMPASAAGLDDAGKKAAAGKRLQDNIAWVDTMTKQFASGDQTKQAPISQAFEWLAAAATDKVQANYLIEFLRGNATEQRPALDGGKPPAGTDGAAVQARLRDPRNDPMSSKFEQGFADETDRLSKQTWG